MSTQREEAISTQDKTKELVIDALFIALTFAATMFINIRLHSSNQNHRGSTPGYCSVTHPLSNHDNLTKNVVLRQTKCYNVFIVGKTSHNK